MARKLIEHEFKNGSYLWIGWPDNWGNHIGKTTAGHMFRIALPFIMLDIKVREL